MKKLLIILLCLPMLFSCVDRDKIKKLEDRIAELENNISLAIGDNHQGGIIFYLDGNGGGLIAVPSDQFSAEWGGIINANDRLVENPYLVQKTDIESAVDICSNLTLDGYSDWFLPSRDELELMYVNLHNRGLGGFNLSIYFSSTKGGTNILTSIDTEFVVFNLDNFISFGVRAIRAF